MLKLVYYMQLADCIAMWGEPEKAVHGMERRAAASSGMKGKRVIIWLVVAFALATSHLCFCLSSEHKCTSCLNKQTHDFNHAHSLRSMQ